MLVAYAPLVFWMGLIFFLSSPMGSMNETSCIIGPLVKFFFPDIAADSLLRIHQVVRKAAHVTEYAILAVLACRAFISGPFAGLQTKWPYFAAALVIAVACLDEFNQSFEISRTSSPVDVVLDVSGGLIAIAGVFALNYYAYLRIPATAIPQHSKRK